MKAMLVVFNNPYFPQEPLWPAPELSEGHRCWRIIQNTMPGLTVEEFAAGFRRLSLLKGDVWDKGKAFERAQHLMKILKPNKPPLILFGEEVRISFGIPDRFGELVVPYEWRGFRIRNLPRLSIRTAWYTDRLSRELAALILEEYYVIGQTN